MIDSIKTFVTIAAVKLFEIRGDVSFAAANFVSLNIATSEYGLMNGQIKSTAETVIIVSSLFASIIYAWYKVGKLKSDAQKSKSQIKITEIQAKRAAEALIKDRLDNENRKLDLEIKRKEQLELPKIIKEIRDDLKRDGVLKDKDNEANQRN